MALKKKITECYYDLKNALSIDSSNREAQNLMQEILNTAENLRNSALVLSLNNRVKDALVKINSAIKLNPDNPEYNLQRGILYKRIRDFNSCIDDFIHGLEKLNEKKEEETADEVSKQLSYNFQRQILLTYNEFAILCHEKTFYDDAITLLNKAIRFEKNEKGFYVNRGGNKNHRHMYKHVFLVLAECMD
jgi:tetratricopeptide (TPR) repeat protein